jgi:conjugative transfer signal peptidase TraF
LTVRVRVHTKLYKCVKAAALGIVAITTCTLLLAMFGQKFLVLNVTGSAPVGLYYRTHDPQAPFATFCLEGKALDDALSHGLKEKGSCPDGNFPLMKFVYTPDQVSLFTPAGFIDSSGRPINHTAPKPLDRQGRPLVHLPFGPVSAPAGTFWALSHHKDGYDSRYFGPISTKQVLCYDRPIPFLTF